MSDQLADAPTSPEPTGPADVVDAADPGGTGYTADPGGTGSPAAAPSGLRHLQSAVIALLVGGGLAVAAGVGDVALVIAVALAQALLVVAWILGSAVPGRIGGIVIGLLAAAGADIAVMAWPHGQLGTLLAVLGLALPAMFVHQLTRGVVRTRVVESLSDIALLVVTAVALAAFVQLRHENGGDRMAVAVVLAAAGALVVGHLVDLVWAAPRFDPAVPRGLLGLVAGAGAAAVAAYLRLNNTIEFGGGRSLFVGLSVGAIAGLFAVGSAFVEHSAGPPAGFAARLRPLAGVLIPLGLVAPIAYLLCLAIRG